MELVGLVLHEKYKIYEQTGTSGAATVCLARNITTSDVVTVLVLEPPVAREASIERRFLRSGEMGCRSKHPYVVPIEDYGQEQELCFMVVRHDQQEETLAELERKNGALPMVQAAWLCSCIASALEGALAYGGIPFHGALRPANIIVTPSGDPKVTGFGIAPSSGTLDSVLGESAMAYVAPEQSDGRPLDARTDLYALGVMLCEMMVQRAPTISEVRSFLAFEGAARMEEFLTGVPDRLRPVLSGLLQWDPDERFASPGEVVEALENAGFPAPQRPQMEPTGPGWERGPDLSSVSAPEPLLLQVPMVGMGELYAQEKTGGHPLTSEAEPADGVAPNTDVPRPEEGFTWETAAPPSSGPVTVQAVALPPHRRRWVAPTIAAAMIVAILAYVAIARPFKGPGDTAVIPPPSGQTVTTGGLSVLSTPPGASVVLDGIDRKTITPAALSGVVPGTHTVILHLAGYVDGQQNVMVKAGTTSTLQVVLSKKPDASKPPVEPSKPPVEPSKPPVQVETTTLHVTSTPASATIVLDGKDTGKLTPVTMAVAPGSHTVSLRIAGYVGTTRTVSVAKGGQASLSMSLTRISSASLGSLRITSTPAGAAVTVDGKAVSGKTPLTLDVSLGHHVILVALRGYETYSRTAVEVVKGIQTVIAAQLVAIPVDLSYTNSVGGFSFRYPGTWQVVQSQGSTVPLATAEVRSPTGAYVRIEVFPLNGATVQTYVAGRRTELEKLTGLTVNSAGTRTAGGIAYQDLVVVHAGSQTEYCLLQSGGSVYQLQFVAEVGLVNATASGFRTILGSFLAAP